MSGIQGFLFALAMFTGALWDVREGRIPNLLIILGLLMGAVSGVLSGGTGFAGFLLGASAPAALLFPLFWLHMLGAGDIKLLMVAGGFLGWKDGLRCLAGSFVLAAIFSLGKCICQRNLRIRLRYLAAYISNYLTTGVRVPYYKKEDGADMTIPFGVPVFAWALLHIGGLL